MLVSPEIIDLSEMISRRLCFLSAETLVPVEQGPRRLEKKYIPRLPTRSSGLIEKTAGCHKETK